MPVDVISNNGLSYLKQVNQKRTSNNDLYLNFVDHFDVGPAYIVELSDQGKILQRAHPLKIARL